MYYDLDVSDWVFEIDETEGRQIANTLMKIYADYEGARSKVQKINSAIERIYAEAIERVRNHI